MLIAAPLHVRVAKDLCGGRVDHDTTDLVIFFPALHFAFLYTSHSIYFTVHLSVIPLLLQAFTTTFFFFRRGRSYDPFHESNELNADAMVSMRPIRRMSILLQCTLRPTIDRKVFTRSHSVSHVYNGN